MPKINLYLNFKEVDNRGATTFVVVSFGGASLTELQKQQFRNRFVALECCDGVVFGRDGKAIIDSVFGDPAAATFVEDVMSVARKYYNVRRVINS